MNTSIYKLTSPKILGGAIYLSYRAGKLVELDVADAKPSDVQLRYLLDVVPVVEEELAGVNLGSMVVTALPTRTVKDKIAAFCAAYKEYRGITYAPTQNEASNIRTVLVSRELLTVFFETALSDFSIRNYITRINTTRDILQNGRDIKERFPSEYNHELYHKLPPDKLLAYQKHLRELGWKPVSGRGWVRNTVL